MGQVDLEQISRLMDQYGDAATDEQDVSKAIETVEPEPLTETVSDSPAIETPAPAAPVVQPITGDSAAPWGRYKTGAKKGLPRPKPRGGADLPTSTETLGTVEDAKLTGMLMDAGLFMMLVDMAIPAVIVFANNYLSKDKMQVKHLQLTKDQSKQLEPIAEKMIQQLTLKGSPAVMFFLGLIISYGFNFMTAKMYE